MAFRQAGLGGPRSLGPFDFKSDVAGIVLSEANGQSVSFTVDVWATVVTVMGFRRVFVGTINTVPVPAGAGGQDRVVAQAVCPGAVCWELQVTGPGAAFGAPVFGDFDMFPSCGSPANEIGVFLPDGPGRTVTTGGALATTRTDSTAPIYFQGMFGSNEAAAARWVMLFDASSRPANGTQPYKGISVNVPAGSQFNMSLDEPIFCTTGLTWALSTTNDTLTLAADDARVTTRARW